MAKKIKFVNIVPNMDIRYPEAASKKIANWFRTMPGVVSGVETVKKCVPFLDSMTAGYTIPLVADIVYDKESKKFSHNSSLEIVSEHLPEQVEGMDIPKEFDPQPHKWTNFFAVRTPKGYSTLFIHPINRIDLPFYSIAGIVDTDQYPVPVNFPFFIKKDFDGVIPEGTPVIQAIPFKRDDWNMTIDESGKYTVPLGFDAERLSPPFAYYKRKFWKRKRYS